MGCTSSDNNIEGVDDRPVCQYGADCYRTNPEHLKQFRHPNGSVGITETKEKDRLQAFFHPNPKGEFTLTATPQNNSVVCLFEDAIRTLFLVKSISSDIWRWNTVISYANESTEFSIGCAPSDKLDLLNDAALGHLVDGLRDFAFVFERDQAGTTASTFYNNGFNGWTEGRRWPVPQLAQVSMEVDTRARTVSFFVNNMRLPHAFSDIPLPLNPGISCGTRGAWVEFLSLQWLAAPSVCAEIMPCEMHPVVTVKACRVSRRRGGRRRREEEGEGEGAGIEGEKERRRGNEDMDTGDYKASLSRSQEEPVEEDWKSN